MGNVADKMCDHVWLGERQGITDPSNNLLRAHSINVVISAQTRYEVQRSQLASYIGSCEWHWFDVDDKPTQDIYQHFETVHAILERAKAEKKRVYVHCTAGISRSSTLLAAHLMLANKWTRKQALDYISDRRPCVDPNEGFMDQLKILEDRIRDNGCVDCGPGGPGGPDGPGGHNGPDASLRRV